MAIFNGPFDPLNEYVKTLQMTSDPDTYLTPVSNLEFCNMKNMSK